MEESEIKQNQADPRALSVARRSVPEVLAAISGGVALISDHRLRGCAGAGQGFASAGFATTTIVGRRLPEMLPARVWERLRGPCKRALPQRTERVEFAGLDPSLCKQVGPLISWGRGEARLPPRARSLLRGCDGRRL